MYNILKSTVVQYNSWHPGAGIEWTDKKSYWLGEGEEVGDCRAEGSSVIGNGGQAAKLLTAWAWNKDTVLLYSIQYCTVKYTKAQPLVEVAHMWNVGQTHELTCVIGHVNARSYLWEFATWRFLCRGLTVTQK